MGQLCPDSWIHLVSYPGIFLGSVYPRTINQLFYHLFYFCHARKIMYHFPVLQVMGSQGRVGSGNKRAQDLYMVNQKVNWLCEQRTPENCLTPFWRFAAPSARLRSGLSVLQSPAASDVWRQTGGRFPLPVENEQHNNHSKIDQKTPIHIIIKSCQWFNDNSSETSCHLLPHSTIPSLPYSSWFVSCDWWPCQPGGRRERRGRRST